MKYLSYIIAFFALILWTYILHVNTPASITLSYSLPTPLVQIALATKEIGTTTNKYNLEQLIVTKNTGSYTLVSTTTNVYAEIGCYQIKEPKVDCKSSLMGPFNVK